MKYYISTTWRERRWDEGRGEVGRAHRYAATGFLNHVNTPDHSNFKRTPCT